MKRQHTWKPVVLTGAVLSVVLVLSLHSISAQTQNREGDGWLSMNSDTRLGFVWGFTMGLSRGFAQGCDAYRQVAPPQKPYSLQDDLFGKCVSKGFGFSKPVAFYDKQITNFYTSFPGDCELQIEEIIKRLSDSENMSPEQMHEWFKEHGNKK